MKIEKASGNICSPGAECGEWQSFVGQSCLIYALEQTNQGVSSESVLEQTASRAEAEQQDSQAPPLPFYPFALCHFAFAFGASPVLLQIIIIMQLAISIAHRLFPFSQ